MMQNNTIVCILLIYKYLFGIPIVDSQLLPFVSFFIDSTSDAFVIILMHDGSDVKDILTRHRYSSMKNYAE